MNWKIRLSTSFIQAPETTEGLTEAPTLTTITEGPTEAPKTTMTPDDLESSGSGGNSQ